VGEEERRRVEKRALRSGYAIEKTELNGGPDEEEDEDDDDDDDAAGRKCPLGSVEIPSLQESEATLPAMAREKSRE